MDAKEILLKHLNQGASDTIKRFNNLIDWSIQLDAMQEYATQNVKILLDNMTDEQRLEIFDNYCKFCGSKNTHCYCQKDE